MGDNMKEIKDFTSNSNPVVEMKTTHGDMLIELFVKAAPLSCENFIELCEMSFYDDIIFHRVIKDFVIQAGDPDGIGTGGSGKQIKGEFNSNGVTNEIPHVNGVISMARSMLPNSASSQFFLCHTDKKVSALDGDYAAFGIVTKGLEVIDKIANLPTDGSDKPKEEVKIISTHVKK